MSGKSDYADIRVHCTQPRAECWKFAKFDIDPKTVVLESDLSLVITNLKCFRPGHLLVIPKRVVKHFDELKADERRDLIKLSQLMLKVLQTFYNADRGVTVTIQDGPCAGQTVPHIHYHLIPKIPNNPDPSVEALYAKCVVHTEGDISFTALPWKTRTNEQQIAEAEDYRKYIEWMAEGGHGARPQLQSVWV